MSFNDLVTDKELKIQIDKLLDGITNMEDLTLRSNQTIICKIVEELENLAYISRKNHNLLQSMYYYEELSRQTSSILLRFTGYSKVNDLINGNRFETYVREFFPEYYYNETLIDDLDYNVNNLLKEFEVEVSNIYEENNEESVFFIKLVYKYFCCGNNQACINFHMMNENKIKPSVLLKRLIRQRLKYMSDIEDVIQLLVQEQNLCHILKKTKTDLIGSIKGMERAIRIGEFLLKKFPRNKEDSSNNDFLYTKSFENMIIIKKNLQSDMYNQYSSNKMSFHHNILYNLCHNYNLFSILLKEMNCIEESNQAKKEAKYFYAQFNRKQCLTKKDSEKQSTETKNQQSVCISESNNNVAEENIESQKSMNFEDIEKFNVTSKDVLLKIYCRINNIKYKITILLCKDYSCLVLYVYNKTVDFLKYLIISMSQFTSKFGEVNDNDTLVKNQNSIISQLRIYKNDLSLKDFEYYKNFAEMLEKNNVN